MEEKHECGISSSCLICSRYDDANGCGFDNLLFKPASNHILIYRLPSTDYVRENLCSLEHRVLRDELLRRAENCPELDKIKEIFKIMEEAKSLINKKCDELDILFSRNEESIKDKDDT